ncbi:MAG: nucleotidyl transferase AbiEii/AbiGii toxin family protein [Chitinophagaceae bacterium]|nr:nucleotidyl transferase AbiEii/AbiGii toxin family protein [Chitinophagaceae bacterium]MBK8952110.1 nucleotidyl transferase AbiEii/AbiGii toxin family protein [Chitinophagaceae bacterium]
MDQFVLVGGTALSLRIGHRKSIDIYLFTNGFFRLVHFRIFSGTMDLNSGSRAVLKEGFSVT